MDTRQWPEVREMNRLMEWLGYVPVSEWDQLEYVYLDRLLDYENRVCDLEAYLVALQKRTPHDVIKKEIDDVLRETDSQ